MERKAALESAMLKLQIPKNRMSAMIDWFRDKSDPDRLDRGWDLYHKGNISELTLKRGVEVHASAGRSKKREAVFNLDDFNRSDCTCGKSPGCEHLAALLLAMYASQSRPELLYAQLRQAMLVRRKQRESRQTAASNAKKAQRQSPPSPRLLPSDWHRYFEQQFYGYSLSGQHSIDTFYAAANDSLLPLGRDWPEALRGLYEVNVLLFMLRKIEQFYIDSKTSYLSYSIESGSKTVGRQCMDSLITRIGELQAASLKAEHAEAWGETLDMTASYALSNTDTPFPWMNVYRSLWSRMGEQHEAVLQELERVNQKLRQSPPPSARARDKLLMAKAHFYVMQGDDAKARALLEELNKYEARDFFFYLHRSYHAGQWQRMLAWLRWLLPAMQRAQQEDFRTFCQYWAEAMQHQSSDSEWVEVMKQLLPRTYSFYTSYLIKAGRMRDWIDLQLAGRVNPLELYSLDLQMVEKKDASLLLPLYTQAIERAIAEKNRTSYQNAVKLLKKLHVIYTKLDQSASWESYIHKLASKHLRLRALQEELRKGNWIR